MTIRSKPPTKEYMENWERIFRPKEQQVSNRELEKIQQKQAELQEDQSSWFDKTQPWHQGE